MTNAEWSAKLRRRDLLDVLAKAEKDRVRSLLKVKHQRMGLSAFGFFRGAAPVMAYDLSLVTNSGIVSQLCGDAHVQNLGSYSGVDGRLIFDINDFDESIRGPFEWDVKRMATSVLLAGATAGLKASAGRIAAETFLTSYCELVAEMAKLPVMEVARFQVHRLKTEKPILSILGEAVRATPLHTRDTLMEKGRDGYRFKTKKPLLWRVMGEERAQVLASLDRYKQSLLPERQRFFAQLKPVDVAFKVVGTGSVGLRAYCVYLEGNGKSDPMFLQVKQEVRSCYAPYLPKNAAMQTNQGQRTADGQRAMQVQSDPLLGWTAFGGHDFLVRQLNDHKASLDVTTLRGKGLTEYARVCGEMLARGHARSSKMGAIAENIANGKKFRRDVLQFASAYAEQTTADWKNFCRAQKKK